jgi:hypothetical protein
MVDIAAVWPASAQIAPVPIPEVEPVTWDVAPLAGTAPNHRAHMGSLLVIAYVALMAVFAAITLTGIL